MPEDTRYANFDCAPHLVTAAATVTTQGCSQEAPARLWGTTEGLRTWHKWGLRCPLHGHPRRA